jgi:hypothetical protein
MPKFLVTYHGGAMPGDATGREQAAAAFGAWVGRVGDALVDPGAPLGPGVTVTSTGASEPDADAPVAGYSIIAATDLDRAAALVEDHPFIGRGGSLYVAPAIAP